jgi:glycine/D-amino acid oxidase-like deaminating enzyme
MSKDSECEIAVIGAGVVGCSIAWFLAERGAQVAVLETEGIASGTSSATLGLVWVQGKEPAEYMELNLASSRLHAQLAKKYNEDVGLRQPGGLLISTEPGEYEKLLGVMGRLNAQSPTYQARALTPEQVCAMEPLVSPEIIGGIYAPHDGHIDPIKLTLNLARLAKRHSARFMLHTRALRILKDASGVSGIETSQGVVQARKIVLAAGTGVPELVKPLGFQIPLDFVRGEILVTAPLKPTLRYPSRHIRQTVSGNLLLGSTHERGGLERATTRGAAVSIARNAILTIPTLKNLPVIRQYVGIRPMPVDGKPYLGAVERLPGLYVAVGHSGITLSPIFGKVISELILDGHTDIPLDLYRPERYADGFRKDAQVNYV